jgi:carboxypeptidase PM20D1
LIGVAEKGYVSLELIVRRDGGHSSVPPPSTAIGILSAALARIEENQMPVRLSGAAEDMFNAIGPEMGFAERFLFANLWITRPLVEFVLTGDEATNAMIRTTTAVTMIEGGVKDNVLPTEATAVVNFRILPGDTIDSVVQHVETVVADNRVKVRRPKGKSGNEPSEVSDTDAAAYQTLARTAKEVFPEVVVGPYLVFGGTDSRFYSVVTPNVYRFTPVRMTTEDAARIHGVDERIRVDNLGEIVQFYARLIQNFDAA